MALQALDIGRARWKRRARFFLHEGSDEAPAKLSERDALYSTTRLIAHREVDDGIVRDATVDRERGDARAGDHGEGKNRSPMMSHRA